MDAPVLKFWLIIIRSWYSYIKNTLKLIFLLNAKSEFRLHNIFYVQYEKMILILRFAYILYLIFYLNVSKYFNI